MRLEELRQSYRNAILALAEKYQAGNVRVFGSVARGDSKPVSDIDILVHFNPGASLLDEAGLDSELRQLFKIDRLKEVVDSHLPILKIQIQTMIETM